MGTSRITVHVAGSNSLVCATTSLATCTQEDDGAHVGRQGPKEAAAAIKCFIKNSYKMFHKKQAVCVGGHEAHRSAEQLRSSSLT